MFYTVFICVLGLTVCLHGNPVMSPSPVAYVTEGDELVLTCTFNKTREVTFITIQRNTLVFVDFQADCFTFTPLPYASCISTDSSITVNVTLNNSTLEHNDVWFCVFQPVVYKPNTTIYVNVPVKNVNISAPITSTVDVVEDLPYQFKCEAAGRPEPVFEWYKHTDGEEEIQIQGGNTTQINELDYESILTFIPNRIDNKYRLNCKAYHMDLQKVESGNRPLLNVLYKPDGPPLYVNHVNGSNYTVIESVSQASTCTITGGNPLATLVFDCFGGTVQQSNTSDTLSSTIIWSAQRGSNGQCKCRSQHIAANATVGFNVDVLYIPESPIIRYLFGNGTKVIVNDIDVIQGQNVSFECHSHGNPAPTYSWSQGQTVDATVVILNVTKGMTSVNCTATNEMKPTDASQQNGTNSSSVDVTVLYPPSTPTLTYFASETSFNIPHTIITDTVDVIYGDTFYIGCSAEGNPISTYSWTNQQNILTSDSNLSIADIRPEHSQQYKCTASNVMKPTYGVSVLSSSSSQVTFNVMYGPSMPFLYYERGNAWTSITNPYIAVIANITFTLKCNGSTSNPNDVIYSLNGQVGTDLTITGTKPDSDRLYTCNVTNEMQRTFGVTETGHNSTTINYVVLYPPSVNSLTDKQTEEGLSLNVTCTVIKGYPEYTTFRWLHKHKYISSTRALEIHNVTRIHTGVYTCLAYNTLQPTFGRVENGSDSKTFFLDVFYKTSIEHFYAARDVFMYSNVTINETDRVVIYCSVDSNPNSNIIINRNEQQISNETNVSHISHAVETAACDDTGVYTCTAYNPHISDRMNVSKSLSIYVLCFPRASKPINTITTVAQNATAYFNVTLVAYPVPRAEDYVWRKQLSNNTWVELQTTDRIHISYWHLQTRLTISNVNLRDYGNYSLTVSNNVGKEFHQVFKLIPQEPPGTPMDFNVNVENKDVRISWLPGFNGGFEQAFVIQLKTDKHPWYNISFDLRYNNSYQQSYTTLEGLDFDTLFNVRMFAYNILGRSRYVPDPPFVMTLNSNRISPTSPLTNTAAIVGGTIGVILVVIVIILVIALYVRRKTLSKTDVCSLCQKKSRKADHVYYNTAHINNDDTEDSYRTDRRTSPIIIETSSLTDDVNTYEHMIVTSQEEKVYSELKHYGTDDSDQEVETDPSKIYINLRINGMHA